MASVFNELHSITSFWFVKAWPTAVGVELGFALEKLGSAATTTECAETVFVQKFTCTRAFGAGFAQDVELNRSELFAPLFFAFGNLIVHLHSSFDFG
jgi:hypothetical protein